MRNKEPKGRDAISSLGDDGPITKENYEKRAMAHGNHRNSWFVLRRHYESDAKPATHPQWRAWLIWRQSKYLPTDYMLKAGVYQVPTEWPEQLDPQADERDRTWLYPLEPRIDPATKTGMADKLRAFAAQLGTKPDPRRPNNRIAQTPEEDLADALSAARRAPPARLSEATLAHTVPGYRKAAHEPPEGPSVDADMPF